MRIVFVSRCLPVPPHFGDRLILFHLLRHLRPRGHRCEVVALTGPGDGLDRVAASADLCDVLDWAPERPRGAAAYLRRAPRLFPSGATDCWHPQVWRALERRLAEAKVDVVHFLGGIQVYEHRDAVAASPRLIQPYESYWWWLTRELAAVRSSGRRPALRLRRWVAGWFERRIVQGFDRVLLNAEPDAKALRRLQPDLPTTVIPQGVDLPGHPTPVAERSGPDLLFVGNLAYGPNAEAAVRLVTEVLPRVRAELPAVTAAVVGADPPPQVLELASDGVEVTGTVPEVWSWLDRARVFVSPLTTGAGMKNKVLEAMAAGAPVVATPESCDGLAVTPGDQALVGTTPGELARGAVALLGDHGLADRVARSGRRLVEEGHRWPAIVDRYEALYRELASAGGKTA